ncbi:MAG: sensor histidine kinase [Chloroflexi bacterium]|nr:MAG: sensor histidine kinase [Chloroflexota bacterium]
MVMKMNRNSIRWRLPASYGVIALLAALSLGSVMLLVLRNYYARQEREYLLGNAIALQPILVQVMQSDPPEGLLQDQITAIAFLSQVQIRLLDSNENVIADSGIPDSNQAVAVAGGPAWDIPFFGSESASGPANGSEKRMSEKRMSIVIYSEETSDRMLFRKEIPYSGPAPQPDVILPVSASPYGYVFVERSQSDPARRSSQVANIPLTASDGSLLGELEFSNGPSYGADIIGSVTRAWLLASVFAVVIAALAGWFASKSVTRPVLALEKATRQMEQGDLHARVDLREERQEEFLSLANSFNGMAAQVEQTISTLREFVADAAHELHTPLTALLANIELAHDEKNASTRTRYLSRAQEQGQRLEVLVQNLLDLSRIEAAESKSMFAPVDLLQLAHEVGEQFASRAEQANRLFSMKLPEERVAVQGSETQLRQIAINLLENALKFTPAGGWISLHLEHALDQVTLTVSDSGIGIPPDDLPHLFERFHRGRNASEYPGNGLGLAIVKAIVEAHQGNVAVQSEPMRGTSIAVSLPVA